MSIQSDNLDGTFDQMRKIAEAKKTSITKLTAGGVPIVGLDGVEEPYKEPMRKAAQAGFTGGGSNVSRMAPNIFSPMLQISSMILPRTLEEKNAWRRFYFQHDPLIGTALELHARFPLSQFRLRCDDDEGGSISAEYESIAEEIDLFKLLLDMGLEYQVIGETIPFGIWNEDELSWDSFILINPDFVEIQKNPFSNKAPMISIIKWSPIIKKIISSGPRDPRTGYIYQQMMETASDVVYCIQNNLPYRLSPMAVSHIARKVSYFDLRGTSIIDKLFKVLIYQDKLQAAQLAMADRSIVPLELWKIGDNENPADETALEAFEGVLRSTWNSPQKAIIWSHAVQGEIISTAQGMLPLAPEWDWVDKQKMTGLMINESLLHGEGPTYANASVAMDYMCSFYQTYRQELENWVRRNVFEPIARARGYWQPPPRELVGRYRDKTVKRRPILPKVVWDKASLRDDYQKLQTMIELAGQKRVPWLYVYELANMDRETVIKEIKNEVSLFADVDASAAAAGGPASLGMGGAPPMDMGGGGGGAMPIGEEIPPMSGPGSPGGEMMPPESVDANPGAGAGGLAM